MNPVSAFPPPRVSANLSHAFGGVWRLTLRRFLLPAHGLTLLLALGVLALLCFGSGHRGRDAAHYLGWAGNFYVTFLVPAFAFMAAAGALRDEMKSATVDYVLTRPVPRPAFVVFKYVAHLACAQIDFLFALAVVLGVGAVREVPGLAAAVPQLLYGQVMLVAAFSALGFLGGAISAKYVVIGLMYAGIIEAGVGQIPTQLSRLSMTHQVRDLLGPLMDRTGEMVAATAANWLGTTVILFAFCAVMLAAAAAVFTLRELAGPAEA